MPAVLACLLACAALIAADTEADATVRHVLAVAGARPDGVCLFLRSPGAALLAARSGRMAVVAQESDPVRLAAARAEADAAGLLERRIWLVDAVPGAPCVADNLANLVVLPDATDADLALIKPERLLHAAAPHGGQVLVGSVSGRGLTRERLAAWGRGLGDGVEISGDGGLWLRWCRPALPGAAEWTHRLYDASFNPVSADTAFSAPCMTQWLDTPYNHGAGAPRIAGGRLLMVMEGGFFTRKYCDVNWLVMRDLYNGRILWRRDLGGSYSADYYLSAVVLTSEACWLVDMPRPSVLVLDPDTGAERRRIDCSALGQQVKWIALAGKDLFVAAGPTDHTGGPQNGVFGAQHIKWTRTTPDELKDSVAIGNNRTIAAYDAASGALKWRYDASSAAIPEHQLAVRDGRLYFLDQERGAGALDTATGKVLWSSPEAARIYRETMHTEFCLGTGAMLASGRLVLSARPGSARVAMDPASGKVLWSAPLTGNQQAGSLIWGDYVLGQHSVELLSGKPAFADKRSNPYRDICTFGCATINYFTGNRGPAFDLQAMKPVARPTNFHKSPCSMASPVGEGAIFMSAFHCPCDYQVTGNIVEMAGDGRRWQAVAPGPERLVAATGALPAPFPLVPADWPTGRGGNSRGNASTAAIPAAPTVRWTWSTAHPFAAPVYGSDRSDTGYEPVQPVAAGPLVIAAGVDGAVRALDLATGSAAWTFRTGGRIYASPSVADGRIYIGSGDGWAYCLEAATGRELWRYQAAPADRRLFVYGHLISTWPVATGVLVHQGRAYFAAGLLNHDATHVYAVDAGSGRLLWHQAASGLIGEGANGLSGVGMLTVAKERLWLRSASFALGDGAFRIHGDPALQGDAAITGIGGANGVLNRFTGVVGDDLLAFGGQRFFDGQHHTPTIGRSPQPINLLPLGRDGKAAGKLVTPCLWAYAFAAWDGRQMVALPNCNQPKPNPGMFTQSWLMLAWDLAKLRAALPGLASARPLADDGSKAEALPFHQWRSERQRWYGVALAANAVVGLCQVDAGHWSAQALDRGDGRLLWERPLPGEPVNDGLAIARDGSVLVQLLDGGLVCIGDAAARVH